MNQKTVDGLPKGVSASDADTAQAVHDRAMWWCDNAHDALLRKESMWAGQVQHCWLSAFLCESTAAEIVGVDLDYEPSRSILYRSAAWLALRAGKPGDAEMMARTGLEGHARRGETSELRDVLAVAEEVMRRFEWQDGRGEGFKR